MRPDRSPMYQSEPTQPKPKNMNQAIHEVSCRVATSKPDAHLAVKWFAQQFPGQMMPNLHWCSGSVLHSWVRQGYYLDAFKKVINTGIVDVNIRGEGNYNFLHCVFIRSGSNESKDSMIEWIKYLLSIGVNPNAKNIHGDTPITYAKVLKLEHLFR